MAEFAVCGSGISVWTTNRWHDQWTNAEDGAEEEEKEIKIKVQWALEGIRDS